MQHTQAGIEQGRLHRVTTFYTDVNRRLPATTRRAAGTNICEIYVDTMIAAITLGAYLSTSLAVKSVSTADDFAYSSSVTGPVTSISAASGGVE